MSANGYNSATRRLVDKRSTAKCSSKATNYASTPNSFSEEKTVGVVDFLRVGHKYCICIAF